jgi:putative transposase
MARKLRIQYAGALYHVINRGNYRRDLFESAGEAQAFVETLKEAAARMGWKVHAYVLMRNHYHVAVETPEPNLVAGMHWLQSTWCTRFNRFRKENGHLFQGRYRSLLVEDIATLGKVVDYIHLNPVRAKIVVPEQVYAFRWSSLVEISRGAGWVCDDGWRARGAYSTDDSARRAYADYLKEVAKDETKWKELGLIGLAKGWAIGTSGWRRAIAEEQAQMALNPGLSREEVEGFRREKWESVLARALQAIGRTPSDLATRPRLRPWKLDLADRLQREHGISLAWLADRLQLGKSASLRSYLTRARTRPLE